MGADDFDVLRQGGKAALAKALAQIEKAPETLETVALLSVAYFSPKGRVIGVTGPPGVGKSTLVAALIRGWRSRQRSVAVIAVDPSSRKSGGALLGDRVHLTTDPEDSGVFVRSMAARDRLGGIADLTVFAMVLMRALYDIVLIETVGVGQSETDISGLADTVLFCVQPGSGDSLQFMKAGIAEIPHLVAVTKADMGIAADRAKADVSDAMNIASHGQHIPVHLVSARAAEGIDALISDLEVHPAHENLQEVRHKQAAEWLTDAVRERFGRYGLQQTGKLNLAVGESPFVRLADISKSLTTKQIK